MNKVILIGNLGADPEMRTTSSGKATAELRVATNEGKDRVEWHRVICWEKQAELCGQYLAKGSRVGIDGRIQTRSYDDKDGNKRYVTEIVAFNVEFLSPKGEAQDADEKPAPSRKPAGKPAPDPFA